jgi:NosR/NirI family nitrous oxide reductase transcriptional regulator
MSNRYKLKSSGLVILLLFVFTLSSGITQNRFPKPEFESDYQQPRTTTPDPRAQIFDTMDVVVLLLMLTGATYFALRQRSRRTLFIMAIAAVLYFGFWRKGCVCSVGSLQNMALAVFNPDYAIPVPVILFFLLPLIFTLFYGRTFCASVCPLGAVQELVLIRPVRVPRVLQKWLGMIPYIYLGFAVLFASTGAAFIICRFDPFVAFFRMSGPFYMLILGFFFLVTGTVVGRPYCQRTGKPVYGGLKYYCWRFLCSPLFSDGGLPDSIQSFPECTILSGWLNRFSGKIWIHPGRPRSKARVSGPPVYPPKLCFPKRR